MWSKGFCLFLHSQTCCKTEICFSVFSFSTQGGKGRGTGCQTQTLLSLELSHSHQCRVTPSISNLYNVICNLQCEAVTLQQQRPLWGHRGSGLRRGHMLLQWSEDLCGYLTSGAGRRQARFSSEDGVCSWWRFSASAAAVVVSVWVWLLFLWGNTQERRVAAGKVASQLLNKH